MADRRFSTSVADANAQVVSFMATGSNGATAAPGTTITASPTAASPSDSDKSPRKHAPVANLTVQLAPRDSSFGADVANGVTTILSDSDDDDDELADDAGNGAGGGGSGTPGAPFSFTVMVSATIAAERWRARTATRKAVRTLGAFVPDVVRRRCSWVTMP